MHTRIQTKKMLQRDQQKHLLEVLPTPSSQYLLSTSTWRDRDLVDAEKPNFDASKRNYTINMVMKAWFKSDNCYLATRRNLYSVKPYVE